MQKNIDLNIIKLNKLFPSLKYFLSVEEAGVSKRQRNDDNHRTGVIVVDIDGIFSSIPGSILTITHNLDYFEKKFKLRPEVPDYQRSFPKGHREQIDIQRAAAYYNELSKELPFKFDINSLEIIHIIDAFNSSRELYEETGILVDVEVLLNSPFVYSDRQKYFIVFLAADLYQLPFGALCSEEDDISSYLWLDYNSFRFTTTYEDKKLYSNNARTIIRKFICGRDVKPAKNTHKFYR